MDQLRRFIVLQHLLQHVLAQTGIVHSRQRQLIRPPGRHHGEHLLIQRLILQRHPLRVAHQAQPPESEKHGHLHIDLFGRIRQNQTRHRFVVFAAEHQQIHFFVHYRLQSPLAYVYAVIIPSLHANLCIYIEKPLPRRERSLLCRYVIRSVLPAQPLGRCLPVQSPGSGPGKRCGLPLQPFQYP
ncbi:hypothetical protein D3C75_741650 [compost metagenome]